MDRKITLYVLGAAALGFIGIMMMMPEDRDDGVMRLPWLVSTDDHGRTRAFGFTIGETTLGNVRTVFAEDGKINLFSHADRDERFSVDAYFDHMYLNGLRADFVITLDVGQQDLAAMYERGLRISELGSGGKKIKIAPEDIEVLTQRPIRVITYLPWKSLDAEILEKRFGKPEQMLVEKETSVTHWLYADKGMDIGLDKDGGVVIQYVNPDEFEELIAPLKSQQDPTEPTGRSGVESVAKPSSS